MDAIEKAFREWWQNRHNARCEQADEDALGWELDAYRAATERAAGIAERDAEDDCPCGDEIAAAIRGAKS